jgi:hypothetical protein
VDHYPRLQKVQRMLEIINRELVRAELADRPGISADIVRAFPRCA